MADDEGSLQPAITLEQEPKTPPLPKRGMAPPRLYFAVNYRSGITRPATVSKEQGKGSLVGEGDAPHALRARYIEPKANPSGYLLGEFGRDAEGILI